MDRSTLVAIVAITLFACGSDTNFADPELIPGGGIGDGSIAGRVNVFVIDSQTDAPVTGAEIRVGEPSEEPLTGMTDSSGLLQIDDDGLDGPTTITVVANGYAASTWFGANGVNITIPIDPDNPTASIPQAELSGTITGWDGLSVPAMDHFIVAIIGYSQSRQLGDEANNLPQPGGVGGLPANACIKTPQVSQCDFAANVRTGNVALVATIIDVDNKGTADDSDDETTVIGFAHKTGVVVDDGVDQSGIELAMVDVANLTDVTIATGAPPTALNETVFILGLDLGDDGIAQLGFGQDGQNTLTVPALTGAFASATYQAIGIAQTGQGGEDDPSSAIIARGIIDLAATVDLGEWLPLPADLSEASGEYTFTPVDDTVLHVVDFDGASGRLWGVALLDGRTTFTLPGIDPDPLTASYDMRVTAFDGDVNLTDFAIDDFATAFRRVSDNSVAIGN